MSLYKFILSGIPVIAAIPDDQAMGPDEDSQGFILVSLLYMRYAYCVLGLFAEGYRINRDDEGYVGTW